MHSYLDILTELKATVMSDTVMPVNDRIKIMKLINKLFNLLWKYSNQLKNGEIQNGKQI